MVTTNPKVERCLQVIKQYKFGNNTHDQTVQEMHHLSGLSPFVCDAFLSHIKKDNIVEFPTGGRKLDG
jgi:hypothetical protein